MTDLISRADAIEAVRKVVIDNDVVDALKALPSAEYSKQLQTTLNGDLVSAEAVQGELVDEDGNKVPLDKDSYPLGSCWCNQCYEWIGGSDEYAMLTRAFAPHTGSTYEYEDEDESGEESEVEE